MTTLYLMRHAETFANCHGRKQGILNTPETYLTPHGREQAEHVTTHFQINEINQIFTSPLQRARETTQIINQTAGVPVAIDSRLLELSYGQWNGLFTRELMTQFPHQFNHQTEEVLPDYATMADGESLLNLKQRVGDFLNEIMIGFPDEKVLMVGHGSVIKMMVLQAMGAENLASLMDPDNLSISKLILNADGITLMFYNRPFDFKELDDDSCRGGTE